MNFFVLSHWTDVVLSLSVNAKLASNQGHSSGFEFAMQRRSTLRGKKYIYIISVPL